MHRGEPGGEPKDNAGDQVPEEQSDAPCDTQILSRVGLWRTHSPTIPLTLTLSGRGERRRAPVRSSVMFGARRSDD